MKELTKMKINMEQIFDLMRLLKESNIDFYLSFSEDMNKAFFSFTIDFGD